MGWLAGIGPATSDPQTEVLPLNYSHHILFSNITYISTTLSFSQLSPVFLCSTTTVCYIFIWMNKKTELCQKICRDFGGASANVFARSISHQSDEQSEKSFTEFHKQLSTQQPPQTHYTSPTPPTPTIDLSTQ
jgi:hypothetical protein